MSSSGQTDYMELSQWDGGDRPNREDFNRDNLLIDQAAAELRGKLNTADARAAAAEQGCDELLAAVRKHSQNYELHMEDGEKERLLAVELVSGGYSGNNLAERRIELGFKPSFGLVWCTSLSATLNSSGTMLVYADTLCGEEISACCETTDTGFAVFQSTAAINGYSSRLNESGRDYRYVVWR